MNTSISRVPTRILYKYFFTRIKIFRKKITFGEKSENAFGEKSCQVVENQNKNEKKEKKKNRKTQKKQMFRDASTYLDILLSIDIKHIANLCEKH
jgi:hypothetical protein